MIQGRGLYTRKPKPEPFYFLLVSPERSKLLSRFPRLEYFLYLPWLLPVLPLALHRSWVYAAAPERLYDSARESPYYRYLPCLTLAYMVATLCVMIFDYRQANQTARRKLRVIVVGILVATLPVIPPVIFKK